MNEDEIKGTARDVLGKAKDATGGLTGDTGLRAEGKADEAAGKIHGEYGSVKDDLAATVGAVADSAADLAGQAGATMRDAAQTVPREAGRTGEKVYDAGARAGQYMGSTINEQPLLSLIGAAAIGYAISFLIHSPMSPLTPKPKAKRSFW